VTIDMFAGSVLDSLESWHTVTQACQRVNLAILNSRFPSQDHRMGQFQTVKFPAFTICTNENQIAAPFYTCSDGKSVSPLSKTAASELPPAGFQHQTTFN
jgi:hypothetical protein